MYSAYVGFSIGIILSFTINIVKFIEIITEGVAGTATLTGPEVAINCLSTSLHGVVVGLVVGFILWAIE